VNRNKIPVKQVEIKLGDYVFPIYGLRVRDGSMKPFEIFGTCFSIGGNYFITALHVIEEARESEKTQIGFFEQGSRGCVNTSDYEVKEEFPKNDLAIIESEQMFSHAMKPKFFKWKDRPLFIFENIRAMGYPHGYDVFKGISIGRGYSGTILCSTAFEMGDLNTNCYELSFQAPRGLSGGILIDERYNVHGVIIGNSKKAMSVFSEETVIENEGERSKRITEVMETTFIGLAVTATQIFRLHSKELRMTIGDYLRSVNLC